jgi:inorganic pyrophosphatase
MAFDKVTIGKEAPDVVNVVIEIPRGVHHKYEYDDEMEAIKLDRVLHSAVFYPTDYGFIPHTLAEDGDHLDAMVILTDPVFPGCVVEARPIGLLDMQDEAGRDWKIIAVADKDPKLSNIKNMGDLDVHFKKEIEVFFREYKELEHKKVTVKNWLSREEALSRIDKARKTYLKKTI